MKTKKDRYQYQVSEASYIDMTLDGLRDGYMQGVSAVMYILSKEYGFGKTRLQRLWQQLDDLNHMPAVFGKVPTGQDMIDYIHEQYGIDIESADILCEVHGVERRKS